MTPISDDIEYYLHPENIKQLAPKQWAIIKELERENANLREREEQRT